MKGKKEREVQQRVILFDVQQDLKLALNRVEWTILKAKDGLVKHKRVAWIKKIVDVALEGLDKLESTFK